MLSVKSLLLVALVALTAQHTLGHICMWSPRQRGDLDFSMPGAEPCYRPFPVCGNMPYEKPSTKLIAGSTFTVEFQQNLNHFWSPNPGYFDVAFSVNYAGNLTDHDFEKYRFGEKLPDYNAHDMVTQTNFTITGTVPNIDCPHCVMRLRYVSNNPDEINNQHGPNPHATFYQCADVQIVMQK